MDYQDVDKLFEYLAEIRDLLKKLVPKKSHDPRCCDEDLDD